MISLILPRNLDRCNHITQLWLSLKNIFIYTLSSPWRCLFVLVTNVQRNWVPLSLCHPGFSLFPGTFKLIAPLLQEYSVGLPYFGLEKSTRPLEQWSPTFLTLWMSGGRSGRREGMVLCVQWARTLTHTTLATWAASARSPASCTGHFWTVLSPGGWGSLH